MTTHTRKSSYGRSLKAAFRRLIRARDGAGAVEFAIVMPLLLVGYIGAYEISVAWSFTSKVGRSAATIADVVAQIAVWRESGVFTERERAALELTEAYVFIHEEGVPDEVYDRVGGILSEEEYVALSWLLVSINAFNRIAIAGRYPVPERPAPPTP